MKDLKVYESTTDFYIYEQYYPKGTKILVDSKNYCLVPKYIMPFEMLEKWKFKEIDDGDIEEMAMKMNR